MAKPKKPLSLTAYALRRGVSVEAVSKAITTERLVESVVMVEGQPKIADAELADREWKENTRATVKANGPTPEYQQSRARREAAAADREESEASLAAIELAKERGELVSALDLEMKLVTVFSNCKNKLLGVASKARQRDPGITNAQIELIEDLIREALDDLASASLNSVAEDAS